MYVLGEEGLFHVQNVFITFANIVRIKEQFHFTNAACATARLGTNSGSHLSSTPSSPLPPPFANITQLINGVDLLYWAFTGTVTGRTENTITANFDET